jgi:hypothetical protein
VFLFEVLKLVGKFSIGLSHFDDGFLVLLAVGFQNRYLFIFFESQLINLLQVALLGLS